jgi:hypothetical protein
MAQLTVAVSDSVFPNLDQARAVLSQVGAELRLAAAATPESILGVARDADALLTTYARSLRDDPADETLPDHLAVRDRRGQRGHRRRHRGQDRGYQGAGLLPGRSVRPRHGPSAGRRAQNYSRQ